MVYCTLCNHKVGEDNSVAQALVTRKPFLVPSAISDTGHNAGTALTPSLHPMWVLKQELWRSLETSSFAVPKSMHV